jgi:ankyrin repeat protein
MRITFTCGCGVLLLLSTLGLHAAGAESPLVGAIRSGNAQAVRELVRKSPADVNAAEPDGTTALHWAVELDDVATVDLLIKAGAKVKTTNRYGATPLWVACANGSAPIVDRLLKAGADVNTVSADGETPLMVASATGNLDVMKALLKFNPDVNLKETRKGQTALMWAAAEGHADAAELLVEVGARVNERSKGGSTRGRRRAQLELYEDAPSGGTSADGKRTDPSLLWGADTPYVNLQRASPASRLMGSATPPPPGFTPLLFAARAGHPDVIRILAKAGANVNDTAVNGTPALVMAVQNAHYDAAVALLETGANPNADDHGWTALHQLVMTRRPNTGRYPPNPVRTGDVRDLELLKVLVAKGADLNARMKKEAIFGNDRNVMNRVGATPFLLAAKAVDVDMMRALVDAGADPLIPTVERATPLMAAAGVGIWRAGENPGTPEEALAAGRLAVELGNDVNAFDVNGDTALHGAVHRGADRLIEFLVSKGAKPDVRNKIGWTPLTIAEGVFYPNIYFPGFPDTANVLRKLGAKDPGTRRPEDFLYNLERQKATAEPQKRQQ